MGRKESNQTKSSMITIFEIKWGGERRDETGSCADPGKSRQGVGGGPGQSDKKSSDLFFFLVLSLFYWSQIVNF